MAYSDEERDNLLSPKRTRFRKNDKPLKYRNEDK